MHHSLIPALVHGRSHADPFEPVPRPVIVANPAGDREFRALIHSGLVSGAQLPEELEAVLRTRYPLAIVRPRELAGERSAVWYVYREGHWIRSETDAWT
jgi:hypothetical protein